MALANVALTDTFDVWRTRTNQIVVLLNATDSNLVSVTSNTSAIRISPTSGIVGRGGKFYIDASLSTDTDDVSSVNIASTQIANTNRQLTRFVFGVANTNNTNLSTSITNLTGAVTTANTGITNLTGAVTTANTGITNLTGAVTTANTGITNLTGAVTTANNSVAGAFAKANSGMILYADSISATRYMVFANATSGSAYSANVTSSLTFNPSTSRFDIFGATAAFGVGSTTGGVVIYQNQINTTSTNGLAEVAVNYSGYNLGTTQFRDLRIFDGKNASLALFQGSDKGLYVYGDITGYYSSDRTLKTNISNITNAVEKVQQINGVEFDWTDAHLENSGGTDDYFKRRHDVGVIAQEIEAVLPEVVGTRADGIKAVKYDRIVPLLIEAIKELKQEIEELKAR
jgi:hypothetical protein